MDLQHLAASAQAQARAQSLFPSDVATMVQAGLGPQAEDAVTLGETGATWVALLERARLVHKQALARATASVRFPKCSLELHPSWSTTALAPAVKAGRLSLDDVSPTIVKGLQLSELRVLMQCLLRLSVAVERRAKGGLLLTGPGKLVGVRRLGKLPIDVIGMAKSTSKENAAVAFAQKIWASGDKEAFARVFAAAPAAVLPMLNLESAQVLTGCHLAFILDQMSRSNIRTGSPNGGAAAADLEGSEVNSLGDLVSVYLGFVGGKSPDRVRAAMTHLLDNLHRTGSDETPRELGVYCGVVIAGLDKHFARLRISTQQRALTVQTTTNCLWALTAFFGNVGAALAIALVGLTSIRSHRTQEHAQDLSAACRGELALRGLQKPPANWTQDDVALALRWLEATISANRRELPNIAPPMPSRQRAMAATIATIQPGTPPKAAEQRLVARGGLRK